MQRLQVIDYQTGVVQPFCEAQLPLFCASQTREMDQNIIREESISELELMNRAALAAWLTIKKQWPRIKSLSIFCGGGNNGGDGYALSEIASHHGLDVVAIAMVHPLRLTGAALAAYKSAKAETVDVFPLHSFDQSNVESKEAKTHWHVSLSPIKQRFKQPTDRHVCVDALLGTGLRGQVRDDVASLIRWLNAQKSPIMSLDLPSGLCSDTGQVLGEAIQATVTITFVGVKQGLLTSQGPDHYGELFWAALTHNTPVVSSDYRYEDDSKHIFPKVSGVHYDMLSSMELDLPSRSRQAHKGLLGHVVLVGGNQGFGGAMILAAEAACRVGAGLVSVISQSETINALLVRRPEVMGRVWFKPNSESEVEVEDWMVQLLAQATVMVIGPGLGKDAWAESLLEQVLLMSESRPLIADADALNLLSKPHIAYLWDQYKGPKLMTPHPGEAARLLKTTTLEIQSDRFSAIKQLAQQFKCSVILKGVGSLILTKTNSSILLCMNGNASMASGGMGDVLAGVLGGLTAQGLNLEMCAVFGACFHSCLADDLMPEGQCGLMASELFSVMTSKLLSSRT